MVMSGEVVSGVITDPAVFVWHQVSRVRSRLVCLRSPATSRMTSFTCNTMHSDTNLLHVTQHSPATHRSLSHNTLHL